MLLSTVRSAWHCEKWLYYKAELTEKSEVSDTLSRILYRAKEQSNGKWKFPKERMHKSRMTLISLVIIPMSVHVIGKRKMDCTGPECNLESLTRARADFDLSLTAYRLDLFTSFTPASMPAHNKSTVRSTGNSGYTSSWCWLHQIKRSGKNIHCDWSAGSVDYWKKSFI